MDGIAALIAAAPGAVVEAVEDAEPEDVPVVAPAGAPPAARARSSFLGPVVCRPDVEGKIVYYISAAKLVPQRTMCRCEK